MVPQIMIGGIQLFYDGYLHQICFKGLPYTLSDHAINIILRDKRVERINT